MPDTVTGFRRVRDRLRARGFVVHEVPHWEGRGKGPMRPRGKVNHFDAIGGTSPTRGLRVVTFGRPDLRNSLCHWYGESGPRAGLWIVCAGVAWHAGSGGWRGLSGNTSVFGFEQANNNLGEPLHPDAYAAGVALDQELIAEFGYGVGMIPDHWEWTARKSDRKGIDPNRYRHDVETGRRAPVTPPLPIEEEDVIVPVHVPPGEHRVFHVEPTTNGGSDSAIGAKRAILVLNAVGNNRVSAWIYFQSLGEASPKKRDLWGGQGPFVTVVENKPMGWLDIANNGSDDIGGSLIYVR
jgi:hypothetical protein